MKSLLFTLSACALFFLSAGEEILFQSNFKENRELKNWFDVGNGYVQGVPQLKPVKQLKSAKTVESNGEVILQTTSTFMGITHKFSKPVLIDDSLKSITLKVVFHQNPKHKSSVIELALTSRIQPALTNGSPFWRGRDSGVSVRGYSYSSQATNFIYWRKEGSDNKKFHSTAPYNMFPVSVVKNWTTAVLSYDHEKKMLSFQCDNAKPFIYHNVDLKGIELNSCFVSCNKNEYKSIEVLCVKK